MKIPLIARMCPFVTIKSFTSLKTIYFFMANAKHKKLLLCKAMKDKGAFSELSKYLFIEKKRKHKK